MENFDDYSSDFSEFQDDYMSDYINYDYNPQTPEIYSYHGMINLNSEHDITLFKSKNDKNKEVNLNTFNYFIINRFIIL